MLRLTEIKLPLHHQDEMAELKAIILAKLAIVEGDFLQAGDLLADPQVLHPVIQTAPA